MRNRQSVLTPIGLVVILVAGLRGADTRFGAFAFMALLILAVATYPPADAWRGDQAAMVLASTAGLLALGLLFEEVRAYMVMEQVIDDFLVVTGSALVMVDSTARLLGNREERAATGWGGEAERAHPVPPFPRG
jgi:hypothetical protein